MKESQLENKTAIATNDYVRMVDENGNSVKIKKDSFMAAIRDALPSIISDGETGGGSVLSIINGALKTRTDANLASVLGAKYIQVSESSEIDDPLPGVHLYRIGNGGALVFSCVLRVNGNECAGFQIKQIFEDLGQILYIRISWADPISWGKWKHISIV